MKKNNKPGAIIIEGHVQGLANTRALGENGIPVIVIDTSNCIARYSKYCKFFLYCPNYLSEEFIEFLIQLAKEENLFGWVLYPSNDHAVYNISKHKPILENYFKVITPELSIIENIYNKEKLLKIASQVNIPIPNTYFGSPLHNLEGVNLQFPVITKGKFGLSFYKAVDKKVFLSNNWDELEKNLNRIQKKYPINDTLTQEVIPDEEYDKIISFTAFCIEGEIKTYWMGVKLREHPLQFGTATFCESVYHQQCLDYSTTLLKALNYTGVCEVEFLLDPRDKKFKLIEINARTWLWVGLAIACGINFPVYIYNYLNGKNSDYPTTYKIVLKWKNVYTDTLFSLKALITGKLSLKKYFNQNKGKKICAVWSLKDFKPFVHLTLMLFFLAKNRL